MGLSNTVFNDAIWKPTALKLNRDLGIAVVELGVEPIKIRCKDNFKYTQIAFLVDRNDFREDILELRKKWLKINELKTSEVYEVWFEVLRQHGKTRDSLLRENEELREKSILAMGLIKNGDKKEAEKVVKEVDSLLRQLPNLDFKGDVEVILQRYSVPSTYFKAISRAIICGEVWEDDWKSIGVSLTPAGMEPEKITPSRIKTEPECTFKLSPYATKSELNQVYDSNINRIIKLYNESKIGFRKYAKDTISNIKRDRDWYLLNKNGKSYGHILKGLPEYREGRNLSSDFIAKAVQQYKRNLRG